MTFKPNSSFKFPRAQKYIMSTIVCPHERGAYKRSIIQGILYAQDQERKVGKGDKAGRDE